MTEGIIITTIIMVGLLLIAAVIAFNMEGAREPSVLGQLLSAWRERAIARAEIAKLKAQHERVCPRLTDTPREKRP